jgi:oligoendopeptidase F
LAGAATPTGAEAAAAIDSAAGGGAGSATGAAGDADAAAGGRIPQRSEIDGRYKWRLEDMFADDALWEREHAGILASYGRIGEFRGRLSESAETLLACLALQDEISMRCEALYAYAKMRRDEDNANDRYQAFTDRAMTVFTEAMAACSYIAPELLAAGAERLEGFLAGNAELAVYRHFIDDLLRERAHILSESEEAILALAADPLGAAGDIYTKFTNADMKFPSVADERGEPAELSEGRYVRFLESGDRRVRDEAFHKLYSEYGLYRNTIAASLAASVKKDRFLSQARKYGSSIEMFLDANKIPVPIYDGLIKTVDANLGLLHRYAALRRRALGLEELHMYDLYAPIVAESDRKVSFEEAVELVKAGLSALGPQYGADLAKGLSSGWIDVYENANKTRGAYSWGTYRSHPYILMNYQGRIDDVLTLAHEIGHSMHSYYTNRAQPYVYSEYKIFVAEVASTVNETLVLGHLIGAARDGREKAYLLNRQLETLRGTLFRQTMFAEFERIIHGRLQQGGALTPDALSDAYKALNDKYFAAQVCVDGEIALEWARIPHFYHAFYVYQYATGISAATSLAGRIAGEGAPAVERYMRFLAGGGSDYPINLLQAAGVDLTSAEPIENAMRVFEGALQELERLI